MARVEEVNPKKNLTQTLNLNPDTVGVSESDDQTSDPIPTKPPKPTDPLRKKAYPKKKREYPAEMKIRSYETSVARHFARIYVNKAGGDAAVTLEWMKPGFKQEEYEAYGDELLRHERIQQAIQEEYESIGIDEAGKKRYVGELWKKLHLGNEKTQQVVLGLLGRALGIGEMAEENNKPTDLPVKNLDKGWEHMTGAAAADAQNPTGFGEPEDLPDMED